MFHFYNNHYDPVEQHCHYLDYINATTDEFVDDLPWYYQRRSYFKKCTMDYAGKTFLQIVNRQSV